jgi:diphosphomevalonate decarboxylase
VKATAKAHPNIALVKYWGKRDEKRILPHNSSLSVTLGPLAVVTTVEFTGKKGRDEVELNGKEAHGSELSRVVDTLKLVRAAAGTRRLGAARVTSKGDFPAAAGLASSAAGFAALAVAARAAASMPRSIREESILARQGSGSASRSIQGGFVRWNRGRRPDGADSFGEQVFTAAHWPDLRLVVGMVSREEKEVKSRDGMRSTVDTSPFYPAWAKLAESDCERIVPLLRRRDLEAVGTLAEENAWRMHASAMAAAPPLCYLKPETVAVIHALRAERRAGYPIFFTLDAGPNPVLLTNAATAKRAVALAKAHGAQTVVVCGPGGDAAVLEESLLPLQLE